MSESSPDVVTSLLDLDPMVQSGAMTADDAFAHAARVAGDYPVVGISTMCNTHPWTIRLSRAIKERRPGVRVVLGGSHTSATGALNLERFPWLDAIVIGEGETGWSDAVAGKGPVVVGRAPQAWPVPRFPDGEAAYAGSGLDVEAGRGCLFSCRYCSSSSIWGHRYRARDPVQIAEEISVLRDGCEVRRFGLTTDLFSAEPDWERELVSLLAGLGVNWTCSDRPDLVTEDGLRRMADSGCAGIYYGVESGSESLRRSVGKPIPDSRLYDGLRATAEQGIPYTASFIIGLPEETEQTLEETLRLGLHCMRHGAVKVQFHVAMPIYGTRLYGEGHRLGLDPRLVRAGYDLLSEHDLELIEQHPDLMASFYSIVLDGITARELYFCHTVFAAAVNYFPRAVELIADHAGGVVRAMRELAGRFSDPEQWPVAVEHAVRAISDWCCSYPHVESVAELERDIILSRLRTDQRIRDGRR